MSLVRTFGEGISYGRKRSYTSRQGLQGLSRSRGTLNRGFHRKGGGEEESPRVWGLGDLEEENRGTGETRGENGSGPRYDRLKWNFKGRVVEVEDEPELTSFSKRNTDGDRHPGLTHVPTLTRYRPPLSSRLQVPGGDRGEGRGPGVRLGR